MKPPNSPKIKKCKKQEQKGKQNTPKREKKQKNDIKGPKKTSESSKNEKNNDKKEGENGNPTSNSKLIVHNMFKTLPQAKFKLAVPKNSQSKGGRGSQDTHFEVKISSEKKEAEKKLKPSADQQIPISNKKYDNEKGQHPPQKNESVRKKHQTHKGQYSVRDKKIPRVLCQLKGTKKIPLRLCH